MPPDSDAESPSPSQDELAADFDMSYPTPAHYYSSQSPYGVQHAQSSGHMHLVGQSSRAEIPVQRKRPKYTRSKTGCLTCRVKKVKCDETKPRCTRCAHGQRECAWPENVSTCERSSSPQEQLDMRASTSDTSDLASEASGPSARTDSPRRSELELPPMRRLPEPYGQLPRVMSQPRTSSYSAPGPGVPAYSSQSSPSDYGRYDDYGRYNTASEMLPYHSSAYNSGYTRAGPTIPPLQHYDSASRSTSIHPSGHGLPSMTRNGPWSTNAVLLTSPDPIEPYFSSAHERNLIHHYAASAPSIILAMPALDPVTSANIDLAFSRPPGADFAVDSLRMAVLGTAAIHQSFLVSRSGMIDAAEGAADLRRIAGVFRKQSKELLALACANASTEYTSDATLAATMSIAIIDIFNGGTGPHWQRNLNLGLALVKYHGGPAQLLRKCNPTVRKHARLFLEMLAVYEVCGAVVKDEEPSLLSDWSQEWWLEGPSLSFESVFGFSKVLLLLIVEVISAGHRMRKHSQIQEILPDDTSESRESPRVVAEQLLMKLESFTPPVLEAPLPPRVLTGNEIYRRMCQITVSRDLLGRPCTHPQVQECTNIVLTLARLCCNQRMGVVLIWPIIIAGAQGCSPSHRLRVLDILECFRTQCCYEVDTAQTILGKVWERMEQNQPRADWRSVVRDYNFNFLML